MQNIAQDIEFQQTIQHNLRHRAFYIGLCLIAMVGSAAKKEYAIDRIRPLQEAEKKHYIRSAFSIIKGEEENAICSGQGVRGHVSCYESTGRGRLARFL